MICEFNKILSYKNYFLIDKNYDSCQEIESLGEGEFGGLEVRKLEWMEDKRW